MSSRSLGQLTIDLLAKTFGFEQGMDKAARKAKSSAKDIGASLGSMAKAAGVGFIAAGTAAAAGVAALTKQGLELMDHLDEMQAKLGIGTETLSKWGYAAKLSGTDLDSLSKGLAQLAKNMAAGMDSGSSKGKLFEALGIQLKDAQGNLRAVEDVLPELADRFKVLDNNATETALAMELLGKSGVDLLDFFSRGKQGLEDIGNELERFGGVVTPEAAAEAARFYDELDKLKTAGQGLGILIAGQLAPSLAESTSKLRELVTQGDLAANAVTLLEGAMSAGIGVIQSYNQAVAVTSATIEGMVKFAAGSHQITRNLLTFGLADGGVVDGLKQEGKAISDLMKERERIIAEANNPTKIAPNVIFAGSGVEPSGFFKQSEEELRLRKEHAGLLERLSAQFAGGGAKGAAKGAAKPDRSVLEALEATRRLVEEQAQWHDKLLDMQADMAGPVAQITRDYAKQLGELDAAFAEGKVTLGDYANLQEEITANREHDLKAASAQLTHAQQFIEDLKAENQLLGATHDQQLRLTAARYAGADATAEQVEEAYRLLKANGELMEANRNWDELRNNMAGSLYDIVSGAESAENAIKSFLDNLNSQILRNITDDWADSLVDLFKGFMGGSGGGGSGGWMQSIMGAFGFSWGGGHAHGGTAAPYTLSAINERGSEQKRPGETLGLHLHMRSSLNIQGIQCPP
ncbi:MAG: hypothetical protein IAE66_06300 [Xanthomonadaceae bacterium]|nr:hypothetical protein [Xanthomonadaceae bacterium]